MTTTSTTPEHLRHHEFEAEPFTAAELAAIDLYELGRNPDDGDGAVLKRDLLTTVDFNDPDRGKPGDPWDVKDQIDSYFVWLSEWYSLLDSLKSGLSNGTGEGPVHSRAAMSYLKQECTRWYHKLHEVRREACKYAFGTAGPQPEVDAGNLTFFDIPGVPLDGTIAAESQ